MEEKENFKRNDVKKIKKIVDEDNKFAFGIMLGLFFNLIGLLIGVCWFPMGSKRRETFMDGWFSGFCLVTIFVLVFLAVYYFIIPIIMKGNNIIR